MLFKRFINNSPNSYQSVTNHSLRSSYLLLCIDLLNSFIKNFDNNQDQQQGNKHDHDEKNFCFGISHAKNHQGSKLEAARAVSYF